MSRERATLLNLAGIDPLSPEGDKALRCIDACLAAKEPVPPVIVQALIDGAIKFRVLGGTWGDSHLRYLPHFDIAILEAAGERFMAAQALNAGYASRGGLGEAGVAAVIDGGAALERAERAAGDRILADLARKTLEAMQPRGDK